MKNKLVLFITFISISMPSLYTLRALRFSQCSTYLRSQVPYQVKIATKTIAGLAALRASYNAFHSMKTSSLTTEKIIFAGFGLVSPYLSYILFNSAYHDITHTNNNSNLELL